MQFALTFAEVVHAPNLLTSIMMVIVSSNPSFKNSVIMSNLQTQDFLNFTYIFNCNTQVILIQPEKQVNFYFEIMNYRTVFLAKTSKYALIYYYAEM